MYQFAEWKRTSFVCAVLLLIITGGCATAKGNALHLVSGAVAGFARSAPARDLICLSAFLGPRWRLPARLPPWWALLSFGVAASALVVWGAQAVFGDYPLARDEHMVLFDMAIYDHGLCHAACSGLAALRWSARSRLPAQ